MPPTPLGFLILCRSSEKEGTPMSNSSALPPSPSPTFQAGKGQILGPLCSALRQSPLPWGSTHCLGESKVLVAQSCLTLCGPMDCDPQGSSVHGILQARILEWVAIPFSRGSY